MNALLLFFPKITIKHGERCQPRFPHRVDVLDDGGTGRHLRFSRSDKTLRHTGDYPLGQSINSAFIQGDGIQFQFPVLFCDGSHGRSPKVSVQQSEFTPYLSPISPCQRHAAPILDFLSFKFPQYASETQNAKRSNRGGTGSKEWPCPQDDCNKKYNRPAVIALIMLDQFRRAASRRSLTTWRTSFLQKHASHCRADDEDILIHIGQGLREQWRVREYGESSLLRAGKSGRNAYLLYARGLAVNFKGIILVERKGLGNFLQDRHDSLEMVR